ncbi:MAG: sugar phosphate isomerase/epimerase family protein [Verrucomicrobium sp.]
MRFAICNEHWGNAPFEKVCEEAAACGFEGLELAPFTLKEDPRDLTLADATRLVRIANSFGLEIIGLHWLLTRPLWFSMTTPDAMLRKDVVKFGQDMGRFCGALGGKVMVWGSPKARNLLPEWNVDDSFKRAVDVVRSVAEVAGQHGATIAMEPLGRKETNFMNTAQEGIDFCKAVDHPACKLHLDVKAMSDESKSIPDIIRDSKEWFVHFHTNDPNLLGPGMGEVKYEPIIAALREVGYEEWLSTEVFDYTMGPKVIAEKSIAYLKQVMGLA